MPYSQTEQTVGQALLGKIGNRPDLLKVSKAQEKWKGIGAKCSCQSRFLNILLAVVTPLKQKGILQRQLPLKTERTFESICFNFKKENEDVKKCKDNLTEVFDSFHGNSQSFRQKTDIGKHLRIQAVLSSPEFCVSQGYKSADQPENVKLTLYPFQLETLAWMMDKENQTSISEPFWVPIDGSDMNGDMVRWYYCPLTGTLSRFAPPPLKGGVLAEEMGLGKLVLIISLISQTMGAARMMNVNWPPSRPDLIQSRATLIVCPSTLMIQWKNEIEKSMGNHLSFTAFTGRIGKRLNT